ncbi:MAG: tryptophan--tRNA ligase [Bacteroidota bacterium]|nr:tryptophan--tRNA ligase [Bacteroidota bacterium]
MDTVLSGIRPTGNLHMGNYFGAVKNFLKMQHEYNCFFFIADLHSLTTHPTPTDLHDNVRKVLAEYLACGLDPEAATIYVQSDVPEISELYLLMNMNAYVGELQRTTTFKEKMRKQPDNVNAGLLTYPVLMATDILIHRATKVPVGKDQKPHLEITAKYARRFNQIYKVDYFPEPEAFNYGKDLVKVPGLDGSGKMGKSEGNGIYLIDDPKVIRKKVMSAVTDAGPTEPHQKMSDGVANLFTIMKIVSTPDMVKFYKDKYNACEIRYGDMKKQVAEDIVNYLNPIRERIQEIYADNDYLRKVVNMGAEKARESASKTLKDVREIIGFKPF